jgi:hypothetical protein
MDEHSAIRAKSIMTASGTSATSRSDPVMSASGGEAVVPQTSAVWPFDDTVYNARPRI